MKEQPKEYTGTWIPAIIMEDEKLKPVDKILYAEIASFKTCFASNEFLANRIGLSVRGLQDSLNRLKNLGYIKVNDGNNQRRTVVAMQNLHTAMQNLHSSHAKSAYIDIHKENNKDKTHTSTLRDDEIVQPVLPASSSAGDADSPNESAARAEHLRKVFDALVKILHGNQKILYTPKRQAHLRSRLNNFKPSQLVEAAKNLMQDPWNTGQNPTNKKYADFDFLTRSDEQVEKWLNAKPVKKPKSVF